MCFVWIWEQTSIISLYSTNWVVSRRFGKIAKSDYWFSDVCLSAWDNSATIGQIFLKFLFEYFTKICQGIKVFLKSDTEKTGAVHEDPYIFLIICRSFVFVKRNVSDEFVEKIKTLILFSKTCSFLKSCRLWDNLEKYYNATGHRWQYGAYALHVGYLKRQTQIRICYTHWFYTATMVARTPLSFTLFL